jgi:hypothetical protein
LVVDHAFVIVEGDNSVVLGQLLFVRRLEVANTHFVASSLVRRA